LELAGGSTEELPCGDVDLDLDLDFDLELIAAGGVLLFELAFDEPLFRDLPLLELGLFEGISIV
jgi:hypothetical protein